MKTTSLLANCIHRPLLCVLLCFACFALSPQARAVCQEGCLTNDNTVLGDDALLNNTGIDNTAIGFNALFSNTMAAGNTATGWEALASNTAGNFNTATGSYALIGNTTGGSNTATGSGALEGNTTGFGNTANGAGALPLNTTGGFNTASGLAALFKNTTGSSNVATGYQALYFNVTGGDNTAIGENALMNNRFGSGNIALGTSAGSALTRGDNNIDIGNAGLSSEFNHIRIGTVGTQTVTFIAGISGVTVPGGVGVIVGNNGKLGTVVSSVRFKDEVKPMNKASEAILALKPVTFRYKRELDPEGIPQFGLVAEEVEKVNPDLVARDEQGKPYTVRYEAVNAMLLNEFLKEHKAFLKEQRKMEEQGAMIAQQQKEIEALKAGLQKVSAQIGASKTAPQIVSNDP